MARSSKQKVIFIDRDGVINRDPIGDYVKHWKDFVFMPRAIKALQLLSGSGFSIIIISNQAGIGDGIFTKKSLSNITRNMLKILARNHIKVRGVFYCLHGKQAGCKCRKPEVGLFHKVAKKIEFKRSETFFIGDKATDMEAGKRFRLKTAFVLTGHGRYDLKKLKGRLRPDIISKDFYTATQKILAY